MNSTSHNAWPWVISSNFAEGLPYAIVTTVSVVLYSNLNLSNTEIAFYTSLLGMPWSFKPLWSPFIDIYKTKRWWMTAIQVMMALCFFALAFLLNTSWWLAGSLAVFGAIACCSATYDIACDGFYMQVLPPQQQSFFVGVRTTAYRLSVIFANGVLLYLTGYFATQFFDGQMTASWSSLFCGLGVLFLAFALLHRHILPHPDHKQKKTTVGSTAEIKNTILTFFQKKHLVFLFCFLLFYRLGEALLSKMTILFLKDDVSNGGLGLSNENYGIIYGTIGIIALMVGGVIGGMYIAKYDLKRSIIPMALALNIPDILYVWMSITPPQSLWLIGLNVAIEQFGYGFGLTAYTVYLLRAASGQYATAHYAFLTGIMALGLNIPGLISGYMQESLGYTSFFIVTCLFTLPGMALSCYIWKSKDESLI